VGDESSALALVPMLPSLGESPTAQFRRLVLRWFAALSNGDDAAALGMIDEANSYGTHWTSDSIRAVYSDYGATQVSHPDKTTGKPHTSLLEFSDGSGFAYDHDVPLDGVWSDLTAQFEFLRRSAGYAVVLQDLHVL
jgi:hypothetical protein